ncbi:hypothetical protein PV04_04090 [Phialophora macrospora]|uniref:Uncharacterized protein n=1 Tax=Phialophora macrospora TaxID=1851006 RepID=A0A0D2FJ76_9EURO|nr:hypothetical protein PV04_04090 [Phialophora macrospora]
MKKTLRLQDDRGKMRSLGRGHSIPFGCAAAEMLSNEMAMIEDGSQHREAAKAHTDSLRAHNATPKSSMTNPHGHKKSRKKSTGEHMTQATEHLTRWSKPVPF